MKIRVTEMPEKPIYCLFAETGWCAGERIVYCRLDEYANRCIDVSNCIYLDDGKEQEE